MAKINPAFASDIKKYGAYDFDACYNCGSCTAVCNITAEDANFPRMFIRHGLLGQKDEILGSRELWLCYACGDCTETCPRQAAPGNYMAALRHYAIANYEITGITKLIFKNNPFAIFFTLLLAVVLAFFLFTLKPDHEVSRWIFDWMPFQIIHDLGVLIFSLMGITAAIGLVKMGTKIHSMMKVKDAGKRTFKHFSDAVSKTIVEVSTMKRYRDCDTEPDSYWFSKSNLVKPWFVHWTIMWGFIGLLVATSLNFILKDPATDVWWPTRILGIVAGILLMYGTTIAMIYRIKKVTDAYSNTRLYDWMFLIFLWVAGLTGFWLVIAVTIDAENITNDIVFVIHTIISMELVILFSFSKFAHSLYRPFAFFLYHFWQTK